MSRAVLFLSAVLTLPGCILDPGACTYEIRTLGMNSEPIGVVSGHRDSGFVQLLYHETKGSLHDRTLTVSVSTFLAGAISSVELRNSGTGQILAVLAPGATTAPGEWYAILAPPTTGLSFFTLRLLNDQGLLQVVIRMGPAGSVGVLTGAFELVGDSGWDRPNCS
ncbi:MAG: hypothetical protein ABI679_08900 [Gemmatimonadota bacterium]